MAYRNIIVESQAVISLKNRQIVVKTDCEHTVAAEDISALLIESRQSVITAAALSFLGQNGCSVFMCDEKHMPCAVFLPYMQHSRNLSVIRKQLSAGEPQKKRMWQSIVVSKIGNQAECLRLCGDRNNAEKLESLIPRVRSGDPDNVEATASQFYFPALFGGGFTRGEENGFNAALNYGYAVLRGCMARNLAVYGFLPALGLHHRSELNAFNLADDIIEPFRPVVDLLVAENIREDAELVPESKRLLFNCLNLNILSGGQNHSVSYAAEKLVQSLSRSLSDSKMSLCLPRLLETKQHTYE